MKKRIISIICVLAVCFMMLAPEQMVFAETKVTSSNGYLEVASDADSLNVGDTVDIKLYCHGLKINAFESYLDYDENVFETLKLSDITVNTLIDVDNEEFAWIASWAEATKFMTVSESGGKSVALPENGWFATITFNVKKKVSSTTIKLLSPAFSDDNYQMQDCGDLSITVVNNKYTETGDKSKTPDGCVEIASDSTSLKVGDVVSVKVYFHDIPNCNCGFDLWYDKDVFERLTVLDVIVRGAYTDIEKGYNHYWSLINLENVSNREANNDKYYYTGVHLIDNCQRGAQIPGDGCLVTFNMKVKKNTNYTNVYADWISIVDGADYGIHEIKYFVDDPSAGMSEEEDSLSICIVDSDYKNNSNDFKMSVTAVEGSADSTITVPLNITSNPGINALGITVSYDQSMCDYKDLVILDKFRNLISLDSVYKVPGEGKVKLSFIAKDNISANGIFANLSLKIKDGAAEGASSKVSVQIEQVTNKEQTTVVGTGAEATITVKTAPQLVYTLGDVNEDGRIDLTDAIYILLSYNEEKVLTDAQKKAADINGDNAVDLLDALQILKYFNGEIKAL